MSIQINLAASFVITKIAIMTKFDAMDLFHVIRKSKFCARFEITTFTHFKFIFCLQMKFQISFIMETSIALVTLMWPFLIVIGVSWTFFFKP
jgi:hypothetical protein